MKFSSYRIIILITFLFFTKSQKKGFNVEVYPSEYDEDNTITPGDNLYMTNMRGVWNDVNPYYGYVNNPYLTPPYMPMYGYNQPAMGANYYLPMGGQRAYNTPNPLNYNYPKIDHLRNHQYNNYPKFKEKVEEKTNEKEKITENLAKELENQIKELQQLTKEAKELAKKKKERTGFLQVAEKNDAKKEKSHSNLDQLTLDSKEKQKFDDGVKNIIDKLNNIK